MTDAVSGINHTSPQDLISQVIVNFDDLKGALQQAADSGSGIPLESVRLRPPLPKPGNVVAMAVNYMEDGTRDAPAPINAFHKSPNSVIGPGDTMILPDVPATIFEGEAEMALVIGKRASYVRQEDAFDYIFRLHQLHRRFRPRPAPQRQHLLPDEGPQHLRSPRPVDRHRR